MSASPLFIIVMMMVVRPHSISMRQLACSADIFVFIDTSHLEPINAPLPSVFLLLADTFVGRHDPVTVDAPSDNLVVSTSEPVGMMVVFIDVLEGFTDELVGIFFSSDTEVFVQVIVSVTLSAIELFGDVHSPFLEVVTFVSHIVIKTFVNSFLAMHKPLIKLMIKEEVRSVTVDRVAMAETVEVVAVDDERRPGTIDLRRRST